MNPDAGDQKRASGFVYGIIRRMIRRFYLYIDDSGSRFPDRAPAVRNDGMDHFALGGILIEDKDRAALVAAHHAFCYRWNIDYPLHSTKIRGRNVSLRWRPPGNDRVIGDSCPRSGSMIVSTNR